LAFERAIRLLQESIKEAKRAAPEEPLVHKFARELLEAKRLLDFLEIQLREKNSKN
jgi:hypothetical protein